MKTKYLPLKGELTSLRIDHKITPTAILQEPKHLYSRDVVTPYRAPQTLFFGKVFGYIPPEKGSGFPLVWPSSMYLDFIMAYT